MNNESNCRNCPPSHCWLSSLSNKAHHTLSGTAYVVFFYFVRLQVALVSHQCCRLSRRFWKTLMTTLRHVLLSHYCLKVSPLLVYHICILQSLIFYKMRYYEWSWLFFLQFSLKPMVSVYTKVLAVTYSQIGYISDSNRGKVVPVILKVSNFFRISGEARSQVECPSFTSIAWNRFHLLYLKGDDRRWNIVFLHFR